MDSHEPPKQMSFQRAFNAQQNKLRQRANRRRSPAAKIQPASIAAAAPTAVSAPGRGLRPATEAHLASGMGSPTQQKGSLYEERAAQYLQQQGLKLLARQLRSPYGEIDILAWSDPYLIVVEVRFRARQHFGGAGASIGPHKKERLRRAGLLAHATYQRLWARTDLRLRFDVVLCDPLRLRWIPNAIIYK